jgi:hypothetical protein
VIKVGREEGREVLAGLGQEWTTRRRARRKGRSRESGNGAEREESRIISTSESFPGAS